MAEEQEPFADVLECPGGVSIPDLKWRELVFIGALRRDGEAYVRDPERPMPPFRTPGLFPCGRRFRVERQGGRILVRDDLSNGRV